MPLRVGTYYGIHSEQTSGTMFLMLPTIPSHADEFPTNRDPVAGQIQRSELPTV